MSTNAATRLVLVTGAGASINLGTGDRNLPLMDGWSSALVKTLDAQEGGTAKTIHLYDGFSSEEFEKALGNFLRWSQTVNLTREYLGVGGQNPGSVDSHVTTWQQNAAKRNDSIVKTLASSLWQEFGLNRIDEIKAKAIYQNLFGALQALPENPLTSVFSATTNYDLALEGALPDLGLEPDTGERGRRGRTTKIDVDTIDTWAGPPNVPHMHLHGAVGWYQDGTGRIQVHPADQNYDDRLTPAILYPDPQKDPYGESSIGVHRLWQKFSEALETATHVLVLGHSLHDQPLLAALSKAAQKNRDARFAVGFYRDDGPIRQALHNHDVFRKHATRLTLLDIDCHPNNEFAELNSWIKK